ncbi:MAG: signal recognition particle subunit SRP19/SEC65 family protein [Thermoplasmata archaeon]|nr:signal recognition particle subunit SRP19/SEC65 family protein [Thermoplasmata archaeon]
MVEKHDRIWALYPEYFDSGVTHQRGRRVKKELALPSPTLDELHECARILNLSPVKEPNAAYPGFWWKKRGRLLVRKKYPKSVVIRRIAEQLVELRRTRGMPDQGAEGSKKDQAVKKLQHKDRKRDWKAHRKSKKGKKVKRRR